MQNQIKQTTKTQKQKEEQTNKQTKIDKSG